MAMHTWDVGSEEGFMACYRDTFTEVYRYAGLLCGGDRAGAEDLVQDVYLAALAKARAGALHELSVGWFVTAAHHRFVDRLRSTARERRRLELVVSQPAPPDAPTLVPSQLASLPDRERVALVLRYVDDLTVGQAAKVMGISTDAAESLIGRALRRVRQQEVRDA
jgi:RNA polymerase sigma-70 factor (ECF subfamily)